MIQVESRLTVCDNSGAKEALCIRVLEMCIRDRAMDNLSNGLAKLAEEDPTFTVKTDEQTGQTAVSYTHLDVYKRQGKCDIHAPVSVIVKDVDENGNIVDKMRRDTSVGRVIDVYKRQGNTLHGVLKTLGERPEA